MRRKSDKPITLRNLPEPLATAVRETATRYRISLNKAVIHLLDERLATGHAGPIDHRDLDHLAASWSTGEAAKARRAMKRTRRIDPAMWR